MKMGIISSVLIGGAAATAIIAAPSAVAANPDVRSTDSSGNATTTKRDGHTRITVTPPDVSDARSYGEYTSEWEIID